MMSRFNLMRSTSAGFARDTRGIAAIEFALIAPALIFLTMGVLEMSFRFRAVEEATRYVHQVADLVSRQNALTSDGLEDIYGAATNMMKPLEDIDNLDFDVSSIGFEGDDAEPTTFWRRVAGTPVTFDVDEVEGMGVEDETVIRVGVRYTYESVLTDMFGGKAMAIEREAFARPRVERVITMDGQARNANGAVVYLDVD
jgi:Flp pilus assembly protein TadG